MSGRITKIGTQLALFVFAGALAMAGSAPAEACRGSKCKAVAASVQKVYWGAWIGGNVYGGVDAPWSAASWDTFEAHAKRRVSILHFGHPWKSNGTYYALPVTMLQRIRDRGAIPLLSWGSWELAQKTSTDQSEFSLVEIAAGRHDAYLRQWARDAASWNKPFFVRFNWEMNGNWYPWSELTNAHSGGDFVRAWRHVHQIVRAEGATNVTWVWCPNTVYSGSIPLSSLYPGDDYVDWTCVDGYNRGTPWTSFSDVFSATVHSLTMLAPSKPIMIAEYSSTEIGGTKATWFSDGLIKLPAMFPRVRAVVLFNKYSGGFDWPIESSAAATAAFSQAIQRPQFASNEFGGLTASPIAPPK